jgi:hypothetical protein
VSLLVHEPTSTSAGNDCSRVATVQVLAVLVTRARARVRALRDRSHGFRKLLESTDG